MKVLTSIDITATSSLRVETIQRYILEKIHKYIITPVIKFWQFSIYYGAFITKTNDPNQS